MLCVETIPWLQKYTYTKWFKSDQQKIFKMSTLNLTFMFYLLFNTKLADLPE